MEKDQFKVVNKKSRKRLAQEMEVDAEVDVEKILDGEMKKVPEPKMPQFKAAKDTGSANQVGVTILFINCSRFCSLIVRGFVHQLFTVLFINCSRFCSSIVHGFVH